MVRWRSEVMEVGVEGRPNWGLVRVSKQRVRGPIEDP